MRSGRRPSLSTTECLRSGNLSARVAVLFPSPELEIDRTRAKAYRTVVTWDELSAVQRYAATYLLTERDEQLYRACCTHAYYAAYAAICEHIPSGTTFAHGWQNPAHAALPSHVDQIKGLSATKKREIRTALGRLRQRREDADYRPRVPVGRTAARESCRDLATVVILLP